jgi:hypothetical protein
MFGLNKITPTKDYCDAAVFHDTTNIDVNIIYEHPDFLQIYKKSKQKQKQKQEPQRTTKNHKEPQRTRKNYKKKNGHFY